jgi:hypothetical protein
VHVARLPHFLSVRCPWHVGCAGGDEHAVLTLFAVRCSRKKVQKDLVEAEATLERFTW